MIVFIALKIAGRDACLLLVQELIIQFSYQQIIISYCALPNFRINCKSFENFAECFLKLLIIVKLSVILETEDYQSQKITQARAYAILYRSQILEELRRINNNTTCSDNCLRVKRSVLFIIIKLID